MLLAEKRRRMRDLQVQLAALPEDQTAERTALLLRLRLLTEQDGAVRTALGELASLVHGVGAMPAAALQENFHRRARESHLAALHADRLLIDAVEQIDPNATSPAAAAAAEARHRRGGDLLESVGKAADMLEEGLQENSTIADARRRPGWVGACACVLMRAQSCAVLAVPRLMLRPRSV